MKVIDPEGTVVCTRCNEQSAEIGKLKADHMLLRGMLERVRHDYNYGTPESMLGVLLADVEDALARTLR